jgi:hypothetical protein
VTTAAYLEATVATKPDIAEKAAIVSSMPPVSEAGTAPDSNVAEISGRLEQEEMAAIPEGAENGSRMLPADSEAAAAPVSEAVVASGPFAAAAAYWVEKEATNPDTTTGAAIGSCLSSADLTVAAAPVATVAAFWEEKVPSILDMLPTDSEAAAASDSEVAVSTDSEVAAAPASAAVVVSNPVVTAMAFSVATTRDLAAVVALGSLPSSTDSEAVAASVLAVTAGSGPVTTAAACWEGKVASNSVIAAVAGIGSLTLPSDSAVAAVPDPEGAAVSAPGVTTAAYVEE